MNENRVDRRKQIVPRPAWLKSKHTVAVEAAKQSRDREKAASFIQQWYKSRLRRPHVFMKGKDLDFNNIQPDYASYGLLRDFLRNRAEPVGKRDTLTSENMWHFQKVYTPDDRYGEFVLKVPFPDWFDQSGAEHNPHDPLYPERSISKSKAKEAVNRRRRKLRDIEGGDIVIRDALFRPLPERGRRFKNSPKDRPTPQPFYFF